MAAMWKALVYNRGSHCFWTLQSDFSHFASILKNLQLLASLPSRTVNLMSLDGSQAASKFLPCNTCETPVTTQSYSNLRTVLSLDRASTPTTGVSGTLLGTPTGWWLSRQTVFRLPIRKLMRWVLSLCENILGLWSWLQQGKEANITIMPKDIENNVKCWTLQPGEKPGSCTSLSSKKAK